MKTEEEIENLAIDYVLVKYPKLKGYTNTNQVNFKDSFIDGFKQALPTQSITDEEIEKIGRYFYRAGVLPYNTFSQVLEEYKALTSKEKEEKEEIKTLDYATLKKKAIEVLSSYSEQELADWFNNDKK